MPEYTDQETYDYIEDKEDWVRGYVERIPSEMGKDVVEAGLDGFTYGNELGHMVDGFDGMGYDPDSGRELDVFDVAADKGIRAEDWVERQFGSKEGDGSFGDYVGGFAGGATAAVLSMGGGITEGMLTPEQVSVAGALSPMQNAKAQAEAQIAAEIARINGESSEG